MDLYNILLRPARLLREAVMVLLDPARHEAAAVEADQGRYLARVVSAVDVIKLSEARLTTDQWEEIGKEIRQPHSKLR